MANPCRLVLGLCDCGVLGAPAAGSYRSDFGHGLDTALQMGGDLPGGALAAPSDSHSWGHMGPAQDLPGCADDRCDPAPGDLLPTADGVTRPFPGHVRWPAMEALERTSSSLLVFRCCLFCRHRLRGGGGLDVETASQPGLQALGESRVRGCICCGRRADGRLHRISSLGVGGGHGRGDRCCRCQPPGTGHGEHSQLPDYDSRGNRRSGSYCRGHLHRRMGTLELRGL